MKEVAVLADKVVKGIPQGLGVTIREGILKQAVEIIRQTDTYTRIT